MTPEYRAPGVYVEEVGTGPAPIEGVPTSIAAFISPTRFGPVQGHQLVTSLTGFEAIFGRGAALAPGGQAGLNHLWHAARAYFAQGGKRLVVARLFRPVDPANPWSGHAGATLGPIAIHARYPGAAGTMRLTFTLALGAALTGTGPDIVWNGATGAFETFAGGQPVANLRPVTVQISGERDGQSFALTNLSLEQKQSRSILSIFAPVLNADDGTLPLTLTAPDEATGLDCLHALFAQNPGLPAALADPASRAENRQIVIDLTGGDDGLPPDLAAYVDGLKRLETAADVSTVAAPGATATATAGALAKDVAAALIDHAERMRYRLALIDSMQGDDLAAIRSFRAAFDSPFAALYYPWVTVADPVTGAPLSLPPSGFVAGIFARTDTQRGVAKTPANEVVTLATGFERTINKGEQELLNPEGINCFRSFPGRGHLLWGARTLSRDPEWKYVNVRRYFSYVERSIDLGLHWCVFEPNGPDLWTKTRAAVETFLLNEWRAGRLLGATPEQAFFVRCDRSTMTQTDIDAGRLICLIGIAPIKPAEFIIVRIGQSTASTSV